METVSILQFDNSYIPKNITHDRHKLAEFCNYRNITAYVDFFKMCLLNFVLVTKMQVNRIALLSVEFIKLFFFNSSVFTIANKVL